ncbi:MAG: enoyl-CoA hydratase-related protein [Phenylobacterium sp.]|nr:enoyl-CoA hydratase-related protein [Phenylobacterium sp.]
MADIDTGTDHLLARQDGGVLTLTLNRPEARNALSGDMLDGLSKTLAWAELEPSVRCIVVTGAGRGFCAGGDVKGMASRGADGATVSLDDRLQGQRVSQKATSGKLFKMAKPTIASLPGAAAGAGLGIALACDLRVMARSAVMTTAFAKVGFPGDYGAGFFLSKLVGAAKARELFYFSDRVSAEEALALGLVNWVVEPEDLETRTQEIAQKLASGPSVAFRYMKENLNRALMGADVDEYLDVETTHQVHCSQTIDHQEAARAFVEKREPVFVGR